MATKTINKFENHLLSIRAEHQKLYDLIYLLPTMNLKNRLYNG
jgi:hypothetical protein